MARKGKALQNYSEREYDHDRDGVILRHTVVEGPARPSITDAVVFAAGRGRIALMSLVPIALSGVTVFYADLCMGFVNPKDFFIKKVIQYAAGFIVVVLFLAALTFFRTFANQTVAIDTNGVTFKSSDGLDTANFRQVHVKERKPIFGIKVVELTTIRGIQRLSSLIFPQYDEIVKMIAERQALIHRIDNDNSISST